MSLQPLPLDVKIFCTREVNQTGAPLETITYDVYGVETEYRGEFRIFSFAEYIAGVIGREIGSLNPPKDAYMVIAIAAINFALDRLQARGYITDMSSLHQAFMSDHITPERLEIAKEAVKWRIMAPDGNDAKGTEYCHNSGGYTLAGRYDWIVAQYDKWTDYYNGCPEDIPNNPKLAERYRNGPGRGVSQVGAVWAANHGFNFIDILEFYYPGTKVVRAMPFLYQSDSRIAGIKYNCAADIRNGEHNTSSTAGCGPCSLKACEYALNGGYDENNLYPAMTELFQYSLNNDCKGDGGTDIKKLARLWCPEHNMKHEVVSTLEEVKALSITKRGVSVINVDKTNGYFSSTGGHYIAAIYIDGWGWWIHNPGKIGHNSENRFYTDEELRSAFKGLAVVFWEGDNMSNTILFAEGYRGPEVLKIEKRLNELGFEVTGKDGKDYTDDYYGSVTTRMVRELQERMKAEGIPNVAVIGAVDNITWNYMFPPEPAVPEGIDYEWLKHKLQLIDDTTAEIRQALNFKE